jgi:hypothetical protein
MVMERWIADSDFIESDLIQWSEAVFASRRRGRGKGKSTKVGERKIAAEVISRGNDGWVQLLVRRCVVTKDDQAGRAIEVFRNETTIRRALKTILRGNPERLPWHDESARMELIAGRAAAKSRFARDISE